MLSTEPETFRNLEVTHEKLLLNSNRLNQTDAGIVIN